MVKDQVLADEIYFLQNAEGSALGPFDCFLLLRGLKTLKLRMDAQQRSAEAVADFLMHHRGVSRVYYPSLASHANHAVHKTQARGGGAVLSIAVGSPERAKHLAEKTQLFRIAVSFGSVNSIISIPVKMFHASIPADTRIASAIPEDLVRLSIGIEDPEELIEDLQSCLDSL